MMKRWVRTAIGGFVTITLAAVIGYGYVLANQDPAAVDVYPFLLIKSETLRIGLGQGFAAGTAFALGALVIFFMPRWRWWLAAGLLVLVTPLALGGLWWSEPFWGINDWDYYFSSHTNLRDILLTWRQLPVWNPYNCGGTAGIGEPEFPVFTPTFLLELIFGIPLGLRLAIALSTAVGSVGMLLLAKRLRLSVYGALVAALTVMFGTVNLLEAVEGHPNILAVMWIPWVLLCWLEAYSSLKLRVKSSKLVTEAVRNRWVVLAGVFLALMFFQGGVYLLMYTALAFLALPLFVPHKVSGLLVSVVCGLWGLGFAAIKLVPVLLWLRQFQDNSYASSAFTLTALHKILLGRFLHGSENVIVAQETGWHEYGAYIGPIVLLLACLGLWWRRRERLGMALLISTIAAIAASTSGPFLKPLFDQAAWLPRSSISRTILFAVLPLGLLAGMGVTDVVRHWPRLRLLAPLLAGLVALDLMTLAYPLSQQAFIVPPFLNPINHAPAPLAFIKDLHHVRLGNIDYRRTYANTLAGYGTIDYCSVIGPAPAVRVLTPESDPGYVQVRQPGATGSLLSWSPAEVTVEVTTPEDSEVVINTNYAQGWLVNEAPARSLYQLVGTIVPPGTHHLVFRYQAPGLHVGVIISLVVVVAAGVILARRRVRTAS